MKLSEFHKWIIYTIIIVGAWVILFNTIIGQGLWEEHGHKAVILLTQIPVWIVILFTLFYLLELHYILEDIIVFRYKIVTRTQKNIYSVDDYYGDIVTYEAKVLMSWFLFIPYWKAVDEKYHSYKYKNLFGGTIHSGWSEEITFNNKDAAMEAIEEHRSYIKSEREDFFKIKERDDTTTEYINESFY